MAKRSSPDLTTVAGRREPSVLPSIDVLYVGAPQGISNGIR
ncbi:MAG: hypothetical protein JWN44_5416 [Myxococcales bacterium]|nr:hypothetical protein [Myxococcales bacterium]